MPILVVEDEPRILAFVRRGLEAQGFVVDAAGGRRHRAPPCARTPLRPRRPRPAAARARRAHAAARARADGRPTCRSSSSRRAPTSRRSYAASSSARATTSPSRLRSTSCRARARRSFAQPALGEHEERLLRAGPLELDLARRRARVGDADRRSHRSRVSAAAPPGRASRRDQQPRAAARGRCGATTSIPARTSSTSASAACARSSGPRRSRPFATWGTGLRRPNPVDVVWVAFALANLVAMARWESWETIPFHFIWVSLTLLYGFRVWRPLPTALVLGGVCATTAVPIMLDIQHGTQEGASSTEVPLMSAMFLAMVWHARRRQEAFAWRKQIAENRARLLERQERVPARRDARAADAGDDRARTPRAARSRASRARPSSPSRSTSWRASSGSSTGCCCSRSRSGRTFSRTQKIDVEAFVEDVFMRWSDVAPRVWRLGPIPRGYLAADEEALRTALDALLENAVKHTEPDETIELRARTAGPRARARGRRRRARRPAGGNRSDLRPLLARRRRAQPCRRRRRARPRDRRRDRPRARRQLLAQAPPARGALRVAPARVRGGTAIARRSVAPAQTAQLAFTATLTAPPTAAGHCRGNPTRRYSHATPT